MSGERAQRAQRKTVELKKITTSAEYRAVVTAAGRDGHPFMEPNLVFERHGEIVGCLTVGRLTLVHAWLRTDLGARGTVQAFGLLDAAGRGLKCEALAIPVTAASALAGKMGHFGYRPWMQGTVFAKKL